MKKAGIGTIVGILALGVAAVANAQGWSGCCGSAPAAGQVSTAQHEGGVTNAAWVCPHQGRNGVTQCSYQGSPATGTTPPAGAVIQSAHGNCCHAWYRRMVPGHRGRCTWNGNGNNWTCGHS